MKNGEAMKRILLDTHAAIWSAGATLRPAPADAIAEALSRSALLLSPVTAWEIGLLVRTNRLDLPRGLDIYIRTMFGQEGVVTANVTPEIAIASTRITELHSDPADRFLVATAAEYGAELMTRDKRILDYAKATKHIRCIAC